MVSLPQRYLVIAKIKVRGGKFLNRYLIALFVIAVIPLGCVSRGSKIRKVGDDLFEVRAWDGYGCTKISDNSSCFTLLMPIVKAKAEEKCEEGVEAITPCMRYEAATADRLLCNVRCKQNLAKTDVEPEADKGSRKKKKKKKNGD